MPFMDGYEATLKIRETEKNNGLEPIPIVALTAGFDKQDKEKCRHVAACFCLVSPLDIPTRTWGPLGLTRGAHTYWFLVTIAQ